MKKILTVIIAALSFDAGAQVVHKDTTLIETYVNASFTDSANSLYSIPIKIHVEVANDRMDSAQGAAFSYTMFSVGKNTLTLSSSSVLVKGKQYYEWDANSDTYPYTYVQSALRSRKIYITFKP